TKDKEVGTAKRNLGQILVQDFGFDHDIVFREIAILYAFKEINFDPTQYSEDIITEMRLILENAGDEIKNQLLEHKVLPYKYDDRIKDKLILAAIDPTDRALTKIAYSLQAKKYELNFIKKKEYDKLLELLVPQQNEFLQMVESSDEVLNVDIEDANVSEEQLDSEINKSALVNLIEGALVEGVRRGVSDIHIFPKSSRKTEIHFRTDGKLQLWYTQENTLPEAVMAVVKDRAKGLDRFERESAQDGYIQRQIDNVVIRYRVSVLPMVGTELKNKFESIVIRILDDRNVIRDLSKLGLVNYAKKAFEKAINQPQGMIILTGPTGSGKSTTLIAALYQVIDPSVNVLTVEDPVEYVIEGARQLKIGH
ncbi:MAG: Flp pilus assembly complex ATPase component TadA, partial [Ignavibacteriae bacterium]|nr:Flp pilus assembly complex ATPase component TadA [Ignavibacteriota bacterium]